ncbi:unnamed protein product [Umbelopsis ramanniana]
MRIIARKKQNSSFYITLNEERYWFPGDCIRGKVTLHLSKPSKTTSIRVCLWGKVTTIIKDRKEEFPLFQKEIVAYHLPGSKSSVLDARVHSYPFEFTIPSDLTLPSFTENDYPEGSVVYAIQAIHDRPFVADIMAQKAQLHIPLLEKIDVTSQQFQIPQETEGYCHFDDALPDDFKRQLAPDAGMQATIKATIPRVAYVRGETIPVQISIQHLYPFSRPGGLTISLCRAALFVNGNKTYVSPEEPVKTIKCDINITSANNLRQLIFEQLLIPTTTPPTIDSNGRLMQVQYKIVIMAELSDMTKSSLLSKLKTGSTDMQASLHVATLHVPIKLGTLPFASMPIDPEEFADEIDTQSQTSEGSTIVFGIEKALSRQSSVSVPNMDLKHLIARSDSITSYSSVSSNHSHRSWMSAPGGLSRNTSSTSTSSNFVPSFHDDSVPLYIMQELHTSKPSSTGKVAAGTPVYELQELLPDVPSMVLQPLDIGMHDLHLNHNHRGSIVLSPLAASPTSMPVARRESWPPRESASQPLRPPMQSLNSSNSTRTIKVSGRKKPFTTIFRDELSDDDDQTSYHTQISAADTLINACDDSSTFSENGRSTNSNSTITSNDISSQGGSRRPLANFIPFHGASDSESSDAADDMSSDDSDADDPVVILSRQRRAAAKSNQKRFMTIHR